MFMDDKKILKKIVIIGDLVLNGNVAISRQLPLFINNGVDCSILPTCLISNIFDYGDCKILDLSSYMEETIDMWEKLGFEFDGAILGYILDERQLLLVEKFIERMLKKNDRFFILLDPIMGDNGKLYDGLDENKISLMIKASKLSDIIIPNFTEACLIVGLKFEKNFYLNLIYYFYQKNFLKLQEIYL